MQLSSPAANNTPTVTQTATAVSQGVPQNQQNIVMVCLKMCLIQLFLSINLQKKINFKYEYEKKLG